MRILIISNLYSPEPSGVGPYSAGLAAWLAARGHDVAVIAANPSYPHWRRYNGYGAWSWSVRREDGVDVHRVPVFVPRQVGGATRILHYASFAAAAAFPAVRLARRLRPQIVIHIAPTMLAAPVALLAARLAGGRSWLHVQDFEVGAAIGTGQMAAGGMLARAAAWFERACVRGFDGASSISAAMCTTLVALGMSGPRTYQFRNWADIDGVRPGIVTTYRRHWAIATRYVALYSGSIARKQGIEIILDAARLLEHRDDLTFIVCGDGPDRADWERQATELPNICFHGLQPFDRLGDLLAMADVHLLPQRAGVADQVLPSKLTNMLASGRPVVATAAAGTGLHAEVEGCGLATPPGDAHAFAAAIEALLDDAPRAARLGAVARARAEERWSARAILAAFERRIVALRDPSAD